MQNQIEAAAVAYKQMICFQSDQLANAYMEIATLKEKLVILTKQVEELKPKE